jgi:hypothetical protein
MESLARLVVIILLIIFCMVFTIFGGIGIFIIQKFFPEFGGWWYFLWTPIIMGFSYIFAIVLLVLIAKFKN